MSSSSSSSSSSSLPLIYWSGIYVINDNHKTKLISSLVFPQFLQKTKEYQTKAKKQVNYLRGRFQNECRIHIPDENTNCEYHIFPILKLISSYPLVIVICTIIDFNLFHLPSSILTECNQFLNNNVGKNPDLNLLSAKGSLLLKHLVENFSTSKLNEVQIKIEEVKKVVQANVEQAIGNQEHVERIETEAEELKKLSDVMFKNSKQLKRHFCLRYYKMIAVVFFIGLLAIGVIVALVFVHSK